jgi:hypothetical protein
VAGVRVGGAIVYVHVNVNVSVYVYVDVNEHGPRITFT